MNSFCHVIGERPFRTRLHDRATNLWPLALLSFGESWHNLHHTDPTSARHGPSGVLMTHAPSLPLPPQLSSSAVRLRLSAQPAQRHMPRYIDGAWWPRSTDLTSELPQLLGGLPPVWGHVSSVLVDEAVWAPFPGRLLVADQVVRLNRTTSRRAPSTVCLLASGRGRWDLLVVPPAATAAEAGWLMDSMDTAVKDSLGSGTAVR